MDQAPPSILGYTLTAQLYVGSRTAVYRAEQDGQVVVIKVLRSRSTNELARFRNQYIITQNLAIPSIVKPLALVPWNQSYALVMEDVGGISLRDYLKEHGCLTLEQVLAIALQLADSLYHLSQHRILHKDINPANILIHPDTHQIWLSDFGLASFLPKNSQELQNPNSLEGTLAYIAPEQTGRMNRGIDYRADFYSLGVTLYELLTGELPFQCDDPMELIHCHIAKAPLLEGGRRKAEGGRRKAGGRRQEAGIQNSAFIIPHSLAHIVLKLMAKNAEDRYQTALGLKHDLQECLSQLEAFELGQVDQCDRFLIPEKLYGREAEIQTLRAAFDRVAQGASELMLVAGYSGVGKTAVVNEVHKHITRRKGYFIKGKFDQLNNNSPFSGFVQALRRLMEQLLSESDTALADWRTKILAAIGQQGQVLINVIPELALIIGPQPQVPELSGIAAKNRFNRLFGLFVQVFTTPEHPLVIFLDDLQWIDTASLTLLKLLTGAETEYLLVLGAYRDNEVSPAHPLILTLEALEQQQTTISTIYLTPLSTRYINQLVSETLNCELTLAAPLMDVIYQKTSGNPFFTIQFLKGLHEDELITFNPDFGGWECDLVQVREAALTDDVVEFMVQRLYRLPLATQNILKLAACLGNQFDLATLAIIAETSLVEVADDLWNALQSGLILPQSDAYNFFQGRQGQTQNQPVSVGYHFLHDRVQQAAYALIAADQKQIAHLTIGRLLWQHYSAEDQEDKRFKIVNQLNVGIPLIDQPREIENLAQLNLKAAQKAKSAAAYAAAASYLTIAIALLHMDVVSTAPWHTHYPLMLSLHNLLAEVNYLNGEYEASQQQTHIILNHARDRLDQVKAYEVRISVTVAQGQCQTALDIGLEILGLLDIFLDEAPLANIDIDRLYTLPAITNPQIIAALNILSKLWAPALIAGSELLPKIILTMLNLSATHGNSAIGAFAYSLYGMLLCSSMADIELGYRFGQLALHTLEHHEDAELTCKVHQLFHAFIRPRKESAHDLVECLADNVLTGLETGDIEFACYAAIDYCYALFSMGEPLNNFYQQHTYYIDLAQNLQQSIQQGDLSSWGQMVDNLLGMAANPTQLLGNRFNEAVEIPRLEAISAGSSLFFVYLAKTILNYLFHDYEQALIQSQLALNYQQAGEATSSPITQFVLYRALVLLALYPAADVVSKAQTLEEVETHQQRLRIWATHAPMNHQHKVDLIEAEKCRVLGHKLEALELYDQAIAGAQANGYLQEQAIANELAAKFYLGWGKEKIATVYLQEAYTCYDRWGAKAKTQDMMACYADLLQPIRQQSQGIDPLTTLHQSAPLHLSIHTPVSGEQKSGEQESSEQESSEQESSEQNVTWDINSSLDLATILKSARALSESIDLDELLVKLAPMMLQTAGAERLMLLLPDADKVWQVRVTANADATQLVSEPLLDNPNLPVQLIHYVQRLQKIVVVDGLNPSLPIIEPYLEQHPHRSVLCFPLLHQTKLVGLLYLDHHSLADVFSRDRITILNFLCAQAAISLANALLNQALEQKLKTQTIKREESEERLQQVALNVPGMIYQVKATVEGQLTILYASDYCEAIYEVSAEAMMAGQYKFRDFEHPDDQPVLDELIAECNRTWTIFDHQFRIITPSGVLKWLHVISHPVRRIVDKSQTVIATVWDGAMMDVSDRKAAEEQLQALSKRLELAIASAQIGIWAWNFQDQRLSWNDRMFEIYGISPATFKGTYQDWQQCVHPDDLEQARPKEDDEYPVSREFRIIRPDGSIRYVASTVLRQYDDQGQPLRAVGTNIDISDRKQAELDLEQEVLHRTTIFNTSSDGIHIIDIDGQLLEANVSFLQRLGYTLEEARQLNVSDWDAKRSKEQVEAELQQQALDQSIVRVIESLHQHKDGTIFPVEISVCLMKWYGKISFICIARDISERKQTEEQLHQTLAQLEASNSELESFSYSVSHDLRAPLRAINGFSQALFEDYSHLFDEQGQDYFDRIRSNTNRMGQLIEDLLQLSRLSRSELRYTRIDLSALAQAILDDLQATEPERKAEIIVQSGVTVIADVALMQVALMNLLQNAWKFTRHHTTARIEFGVLPPDSPTSTSSTLIYFVKDDGAGFDMTYSNKLFGVFQRLHSTHEFPGTGIGLASVRRAITRHGGQVWAEAAVEQGATIFFTVPIRPDDDSCHDSI